MERPLWDKQYIQYDLIRLRRKYKKFGYELSLEQCYDVWYMFSVSEYSNWLETIPELIEQSVVFIDKVLNNCID